MVSQLDQIEKRIAVAAIAAAAAAAAALVIAVAAEAEEAETEAARQTSLDSSADKSSQARRIPGKRGDGKGPTSLFIFTENNFVRRYARTIIEWGYPFI
ncbi:hypothetical protein T4B_14553 [Trichinella pseudospiralis]|uniref:Uncharacterized protein n=2 Tax=Trichinella pseudospiralis TaxID=6337 RepID=A0A0V1FQ27_TRIPS|nr:hypothetical protein T4D_9297 [Trichinella pseudospiralis]KRZ31386.1 hypothetical protein T4B_14553 [Trichinella pseudospiralis]